MKKRTVLILKKVSYKAVNAEHPHPRVRVQMYRPHYQSLKKVFKAMSPLDQKKFLRANGGY